MEKGRWLRFCQGVRELEQGDEEDCDWETSETLEFPIPSTRVGRRSTAVLLSVCLPIMILCSKAFFGGGCFLLHIKTAVTK